MYHVPGLVTVTAVPAVMLFTVNKLPDCPLRLKLANLALLLLKLKVLVVVEKHCKSYTTLLAGKAKAKVPLAVLAITLGIVICLEVLVNDIVMLLLIAVVENVRVDDGSASIGPNVALVDKNTDPEFLIVTALLRQFIDALEPEPGENTLNEQA